MGPLPVIADTRLHERRNTPRRSRRQRHDRESDPGKGFTLAFRANSIEDRPHAPLFQTTELVELVSLEKTTSSKLEAVRLSGGMDQVNRGRIDVPAGIRR